MRLIPGIVAVLSCWPSLTYAQGENTKDLQNETAAALRSQRHEDAIKAATKIIDREPKNARAHSVRAFARLQLDQPQEAIADLDRAIELHPDNADFQELRGTALFMLSRFKDAIADFDREIKISPEREPWHWKRGLAYYYAGEFDKGRRQFERYHERADNDVENGVWRLLCMAKMREFGLAGARKQMLTVRPDSRLGMMEAYAMFAGDKTPDEVLAAFEAGKPSDEELNERRFYAHLYVGLYHDLTGQLEDARKHLAAAVKHPIAHFMHDIARLHLAILEKQAKREPGSVDSSATSPSAPFYRQESRK